MKDILEKIMDHKRHEVEIRKREFPLQDLAAVFENRMRQGELPPVRSLSNALRTSTSGIISEFKRKSPSKGWIARYADPSSVAPAYERGGATALSILTDAHFFGGSGTDLRMARPLVQLPILRKDFICDEYQLYEARLWGADAILLIASALERKACTALAYKAHELGLEVLLEIHHELELDYLYTAPDIVGINNRHLGTFDTDTEHSFRMSEQLPADMTRISESGISDPSTVRYLRQRGFNGFLIGEHFMRDSDPGECLRQFLQKLPS